MNFKKKINKLIKEVKEKEKANEKTIEKILKEATASDKETILNNLIKDIILFNDYEEEREFDASMYIDLLLDNS